LEFDTIEDVSSLPSKKFEKELEKENEEKRIERERETIK